ncbi:hypothetical protein ACO1O0_007514 [Amphichorda felina]
MPDLFHSDFGDIVSSDWEPVSWPLGPLAVPPPPKSPYEKSFSGDSESSLKSPLFSQSDGVANSIDELFEDPNLDLADALTVVSVESDTEAHHPVRQSMVVPVETHDSGAPGKDDRANQIFELTTDNESDVDDSTEASPGPQLPASGSVTVEIPESTLVTPRSHYDPFDPGVPIVSERTAVNTLSEVAKSMCDTDDDFLEFELNDFAVYSEYDFYGVEMRPLHQLGTQTNRAKLFYMDGILSAGEKRLFVRRAPIYALPIGNYSALDEHTVRDSLWILSRFNERRNVYYRLGNPAREYARFFNPFLWVADLAKHFVDYIKSMWEGGSRVSIHDFRAEFGRWVRKVHGDAPVFLEWLSAHPSQDFRTSIIANLPFLHKEAIGVLGERQVYVHKLWEETLAFKRFNGPPKELHDGENPPTIVTPYIMDCFKHLPFGDRLQTIPFSAAAEKLRNSLIRKRHLELPHDPHQGVKSLSIAAEVRIKNIQPGDTISTHRDAEDSGTQWEREEAKDFHDVDRWFALVQKVHVDKMGRRSFDVTWYYRPVETLCGLMKYPWNNELFLSDHCSCNERTKIKEDEILGVHDVEFNGTGTTTAELFCRQTYMHEERKWVTLKPNHLMCEHLRSRDGPGPGDAAGPGDGASPRAGTDYLAGDTVLVHLDRGSNISEPCEVVSFSQKEFAQKKYGHLVMFEVRRLLRRRQIDPLARDAPPNELVYPNEHTLVTVSECAILDRCSVRFFKENEPIPTPYDRDGVGALFFITHEQKPDQTIVPLEEFPTSLNQGLDPRRDIPKLRGLDLFCGGGNFGRGLEDGGGIQMKWANDYNSKAIHTYMANVDPEVEDVHPFLGSIDILQRLAIKGKFSKSVPKIGQVDFISAGSPCPGFSKLTNDKTTVKQRKNQSLVAAFASFVDLYRPKYGLLENVIGIVQNKANRDQDVFSQLICALVGLGYQTQFYFLDASSCGSPQRRSRVFVVFAAPGCELPQQPQQTHSHPPNTKNLGIGKLPNGENMARRRMPAATPFKFVTGEEATADLPPIQDAKPDISISHPDHRVSMGMTKKVRMGMYHIPTRPFGMNFAKAWYGLGRPVEGAGILTRAERELYPARCTSKDAGSLSRAGSASQSYGRQYPNRLIETVTTTSSPHDAKAGRQIHWRENRTVTIMEARRAQGFRDSEVLLGNPTDQHRIVGNSVAREISVALGIAFREAWAATLKHHGAPAREGKTAVEPIVIDDSASSADEDSDDVPRTIARGSASVTPLTSRSSSQFPKASPGINANGKRSALIIPLGTRPSKFHKSIPSEQG